MVPIFDNMINFILQSLFLEGVLLALNKTDGHIRLNNEKNLYLDYVQKFVPLLSNVS